MQSAHRFAKTVANSKVYRMIVDEVHEEDKSAAHKRDDLRTEAYAEAFNSRIEKIDETSRIAGKVARVLAGFAIKPELLEEQKSKTKSHVDLSQPEGGSVQGEHDYHKVEKETQVEKFQRWRTDPNKSGLKKAALLLMQGTKIGGAVVAETVVEGAQFTVRNTVKQPVMTVYRAGAVVATAGEYGIAKIQGNQELAEEKLDDLKYQTNKFTRAAVATVAIGVVDLAMVSSFGVGVFPQAWQSLLL